MKRIIILIITMWLAIAGWAQHLPVTSSYMYNGLYINPAYAGSREVLSLDVFARKQWLGIDGAPTTFMMSGHLPLKNEKVGLGLLAYNDKIGVANNTGIYGNYAYRIYTRSGILSMGLGLGMDFFQQNWTDVVTTENADPVFLDNFSAVLPNVSFGVYYYTDRYFVGFSNPFMLRRNYVDNTIQMGFDIGTSNYLLEGGMEIELSENFVVKPSILLKTIPKHYLQLDVNCVLSYNNLFGMGISYRNNRDWIGLLFLKLTDNTTFTYAYDYPLKTDFRNLSSSHEVYLRFDMKKEVDVVCPRYF